MQLVHGTFPRAKSQNTPCFHTFCLPCLTTLQASITVRVATPENQQLGGKSQPTEEKEKETDTTEDKTGGDENNKAESGDVTSAKAGNEAEEKAVFFCPTCRAPVAIPEEGVAALQTNFYLDHEDSPEGSMPPAFCDMCEEGNQQRAAYACQQCHLRMCRTCRRHHDMLTRNHHVTSASLDQPGKGRSEKKGFCLVHQDQALCFQCRQCDISICLHCKLTSHEGHKTSDLASAALQAKEAIRTLVSSAQQQLQVMESAQRRMERDERELTRHVQKMTQHVSARCDVLVTWAHQSRDEVLEEVKTKEDSAKSQLHAEKTATGVTMETLSALISRAAHVTGSDPDVVLLEKEFRAALLSEDKLDHYRQQADRKRALWGWSYNITDTSPVEQDTVQTYMGRVEEEEGTNNVTMPLSVRELADRLDRLANDVTQTNVNVTALMSQMTACKDDISTSKKVEADLQSKMTENDMNKKLTSLADDVKTLKKTEDDLKKATSSVKDKIGKAGRMVSFYAKGVDKAKTKHGKAILFDVVDINEGGFYDKTTGVFTAPVSGTYVITATVGSGTKDHSAAAFITVDNSVYTNLRACYDSSACGSVSVHLRTGQKVYIEAWNDGGSYCSDEMSFNGALLQPDL